MGNIPGATIPGWFPHQPEGWGTWGFAPNPDAWCSQASRSTWVGHQGTGPVASRVRASDYRTTEGTFTTLTVTETACRVPIRQIIVEIVARYHVHVPGHR